MSFNDFVGTMRERPMLELERWCRAWDLDHPVGSSISFRHCGGIEHGKVLRGSMMIVRDGHWGAYVKILHGCQTTGCCTMEIPIDSVVDDA